VNRSPTDLSDPFLEMGAAELREWLRDAARLWLAHDGLWFQELEARRGMDEAISADAAAWGQFSPLEARLIMKRLGLAPGGGIAALARCLAHRLYAHLNRQAILEESADRCVLELRACRVQEARRRKGLDDFPCREVGLVEYTTFAQTVDPRLRTRCLGCPPDPHPEDWWCRWEFRLAASAATSGAPGEDAPPREAR